MVDQVQITPADNSPPEPPAADRIPEKYRGAADPLGELIKGHAELEAKLGANPPANEPPAGDTPPAPDNPLSMKPPAAPAEGLLAPFVKEVMTGGELSDASFGKLEKMGVTRAEAVSIKEALEFRAEAHRTECLAAVGGEEAFGQMIEWGMANLTEAQISAYETAVHSGDPQQAQMAVNYVAGLWRDSGNAAPVVSPVEGGTVAAPHKGFQSQAEMTAAMRDPRWKNGDPAYHEEVRRKMAANPDIMQTRVIKSQ